MKQKDWTVLWWIGWILLTILSFFVSCWFWTGYLSRHAGTMDKPGMPMLWVGCVFGSWMVLLVPLIVLMYNKVDRAYEDARLSREKDGLEKMRSRLGVRAVMLKETDRRLDASLSQMLRRVPETIRQGHLVTAVLKDGRRFENVFVLSRREILGIYDQTSAPFTARDIAKLEPADLDRLPAFEPSKWLRLDGAGLE